MPRSLALLLALLAFVPAADGGTRGNPEIVDGTREVDALYPGSPATTIGVPEIDFTRVWLDADGDAMGIHWEVVDFEHRFQEKEFFIYGLSFDCGGVRSLVTAAFIPYEGLSQAVTDFRHPDGTVRGLELPLFVEGNVIRTEIPRSYLACAKITQIVASDGLGYDVEVPLVGLRSTQGAWFHDEAPDVGFGRDFVF
jgi:hypothetical protein